LLVKTSQPAIPQLVKPNDTPRLAGLALVLMAALLYAAESRAQYTWETPTNKVVLMAVNAHPDDEGIFFGGTLPYYSQVLGLPTLLVSMTSGDWYPTNLTIREAELRCAASNYGLRYEPVFLRFRDVPSQNMTGNPYTNKIDATWDYWADGVLQGDGADVEAGKQKAINTLAEQIRRYRPDIIITHDQAGEYGHHNHIATCWAVTNAFYVAADPAATAPNLAGLPPWQVKKLYIHLYPQNRLFHQFFELPCSQLGGLTPRQVADIGLDCHVSQGKPDVSTVYRTGENYDPYPSEWWGLYASVVGPDSTLPAPVSVNGFTVPAGVSCGNFLEHTGITNFPAPPVFAANLVLPAATSGASYPNVGLAGQVADPDLPWGDVLRFAKLSGPAWLTVSPEGKLSGVPGVQDLGANVFVVQVTDSYGYQDTAQIQISVQELFPNLANLVGWWQLDESAGTVIQDATATAQDGAVVGGVTLNQAGATPLTHQSAWFNGVNGCVEVPFAAELNPAQFTAALWVKPSQTFTAYASPLTSREAVPHAGYIFYAGQNNLWQFWLGTGSAWKSLSAGAVKANSWIHLAGTYDGTTARFYTNGVLAAAAQTSFQGNSQFPLRIGGGATETSGDFWFPGNVDDVRVYSKVLSAGELGALVTNTAPRFLAAPSAASAWAGTPFQGTLPAATDPEGNALQFGKTAGPTWLRVAADGALSGTPASADVGPNHFQVAVSDQFGALNTASLDVYVLPGRAPVFTGINVSNFPAIRLNLSGVAGQQYLIQSAGVISGPWQAIGTNAAGISPFECVTRAAAGETNRFYRAVVP
jgi:LmbE family N-acetylglucosaminyl deacetylase